MRPPSRRAIFDRSLSMQMTLFPFSARHAPSTRPTYPVPTTAIFISQQDTDSERLTQVRVLLDYRAALRQRSGVGEYAFQLARALVAAFPPGPRAPLDLTLFSSSW